MRIFNSLDNLPSFTHPVITLGTFDGVHIGHKEILRRVKEAARKRGGESILLTFWPHPRMVLQPDDDSLKLLNTIDEKVKLIEEQGIDNLIIIPFTFEFSRTPYLVFIRDILVNILNAEMIIVGHDHHFGKNREGSFEQLKECAPLYGFELEQVPAMQMDGVNVSSSKIRAALLEEELDKANRFLGYEYSLSGEVIHGDKIGRTLGYPTANVEPEEKYKLVPANGVYVVKAKIDSAWHQGMSNIGFRPTFSGIDIRVEVNVLGFNRNIYGQKIEIKFLHFLRKEIKFVKVDDLIAQIDADKQLTLQYFSNP